VIVLDTDLLTIVQRANSPEYNRLVARLNAAPDQLIVTTIVSIEEQVRGWLAWIAQARSLEQQVEAYGRLHALFEDFQTRPVLAFDSLAAGEFQRLKRMKVRIGALDLRIASIALAHDGLLLSRNLRDFRKVPDLKVEDWTATSL
jgi:tRNA(fMet)-specific endonuclease VapC